MKCEMPACSPRSSRPPAPIHMPIATERTERTRSVTMRSPPSSVVTVYRCTRRTLAMAGPGGPPPIGGGPPCRVLAVAPPAAVAIAAAAARAVARGALRRRVRLGDGDQLLGGDLRAVVVDLGNQREADAAAVLVDLGHRDLHLVAA